MPPHSLVSASHTSERTAEHGNNTSNAASSHTSQAASLTGKTKPIDSTSDSTGEHVDLPSLKPISSSVPTPNLTLTREICLVTVVVFAQLVARGGLIQGVAPVNYIGGSFGTTDVAQTAWFPAAYSLTAGTFILIAGRIGDIVGQKTLFIFGFAWFSLWSLLAGLSVYPRSMIFFDICRALQGSGAAILTPTGLAILGSVYGPSPRKNMIFALFGAAAPSGILLGASFSSLLAQFAWWPWAYWIMSILCFCVAIVAFFAIPPLSQKDHASEESSERQRFDYLGSVIGVAGLILFNVVWNQAPVVGWNSPYIIILLILGITFCAVFCLVEIKVAQPLVPVKSMSRDAVYVLGCVALGWSSFGIWFYYFWEFLETIRKAKPLEATAQIVPSLISGLAAAVTTGFLLSRVRKSLIIIVAMLAFCIGNAILATMPADQVYWKQAFWTVVIVPWGMDLSFPTASVLMSDLVPRRHQGIAGSCVATIMNYSISIGLGIGGTVYSNTAAGNILRGYHDACFAAIGLSGCGVILACVYALDGSHRQSVKGKKSEKEQN